ncbi:hypothetical protein Acsp03_01690 [Actinomadura sp. NBRC 104412]|uniref:DUF2795 domain-containing protein n=1 Tax=Actinomadura sp. NBRC 104412 TaxID=3032203 RepID=UPI0024A08319|nr:DUF2795 domain-containing protein [Actinomadura sp. NBRC 104412]GLZ02702.1 hypothetical protein Acsp03_01690 [Actinomadura sp. NBRC 104412]
MRVSDTRRIEEMLGDLAFPASKQQIVAHAHYRRPGSAAERALAALPLGDYDNVEQVLRSVPTEPDPGRSPAERDYQRTHHRKPLLAEHMRDSEEPPVQEELHREPRRRG